MIQSIYYPKYKVHVPKYSLVRDEPKDTFYEFSEEGVAHTNMLFHVAEGDYLTTLATILEFFEDSMRDDTVAMEVRELQRKAIRGAINDLLYLDKHYTIAPKDKSEANGNNEKSI